MKNKAALDCQSSDTRHRYLALGTASNRNQSLLLSAAVSWLLRLGTGEKGSVQTAAGAASAVEAKRRDRPVPTRSALPRRTVAIAQPLWPFLPKQTSRLDRMQCLVDPRWSSRWRRETPQPAALATGKSGFRSAMTRRRP